MLHLTQLSPQDCRLRGAGFIDATSQSDAQLFYRCCSDLEKLHYAANEEAWNSMGRLLGYDKGAVICDD